MSSFRQVSKMNTAFGNPKGDRQAVSKSKLRKQCLNIADEFGELFVALGADPDLIKAAVANLKWVASRATGEINVNGARDALCDIHVFGYGGHHFMCIDADTDMEAVVNGVMTRFVKDEADLKATLAIHAAKGVTEIYLEGEFPTMVVKSAKDQPDAPKGKFLKSASYKDTVFEPIELVFVD